MATVRGFYGDYDVTVNANGVTETNSFAFHKGYDNIAEIILDGEAIETVVTVPEKSDVVIKPADTPVTELPEDEVTYDSSLPQGGKVIFTMREIL